MKILTILGARPQFIKAAVVSRSIHSHNSKQKQMNEIIVHTGQHYDANMSDIFFKEMSIPEPDHFLGVCDSSHGAMTGRMMEKVEDIMLSERPDVVLVYGDTNSTLAGALAAAKLKIPVAHVEAGLRSFNMNMPEEINRIVTDRISRFLFCPTETAMNNLSDEGMLNGSRTFPYSPLAINVGDVMYDAVLYYKEMSRPSDKVMRLTDELDNNFYLATVHRAENTDDPERLNNIAEAFNKISNSKPIVFPMHPRTRKELANRGINLNGVRVIDSVGYFDMICLLESCKAVFTDSGGLQKEAYFFGKPCVTLRDNTEWVELIKHGVNNLVGAKRDKIIEAEKKLNSNNNNYSATLYGAGDAGDKIVQVLFDSLQ